MHLPWTSFRGAVRGTSWCRRRRWPRWYELSRHWHCPWPCLLRCVHGHNHNRNALASDELLLFLPQQRRLLKTWWWGRTTTSTTAGGTSHIYNSRRPSLVAATGLFRRQDRRISEDASAHVPKGTRVGSRQSLVILEGQPKRARSRFWRWRCPLDPPRVRENANARNVPLRHSLPEEVHYQGRMKTARSLTLSHPQRHLPRFFNAESRKKLFYWCGGPCLVKNETH
jgi:hypothetical protein